MTERTEATVALQSLINKYGLEMIILAMRDACLLGLERGLDIEPGDAQFRLLTRFLPQLDRLLEEIERKTI